MCQPETSSNGAADDPLAAEFAHVHPNERQRFLVAREGDAAAAAEMLRSHLAWRDAHFPRPPDAPRIGSDGGLPEFAWVCPGRANNGTHVIICQPCMIDPKLGHSEDEYILALFQLIDAACDRASTERCTVLIDNRGREDGANVPGLKLVPLGQKMSKCLSDHCPERLDKLVVYPVPAALYFIWGLVRPFMAPKTADKVRLLMGPAGRTSPCPAKLAEYVCAGAMREQDRPRHAGLPEKPL